MFEINLIDLFIYFYSIDNFISLKMNFILSTDGSCLHRCSFEGYLWIIFKYTSLGSQPHLQIQIHDRQTIHNMKSFLLT